MYVIKYVIEKYVMGFYLKIQGTLLQRGTKVFEEVLVEQPLKLQSESIMTFCLKLNCKIWAKNQQFYRPLNP